MSQCATVQGEIRRSATAGLLDEGIDQYHSMNWKYSRRALRPHLQESECQGIANAIGTLGNTHLRERAQRIGSQFNFWSEIGAGVEVELAVPASLAYQKRHNALRFRMFRRAASDVCRRHLTTVMRPHSPLRFIAANAIGGAESLWLGPSRLRSILNRDYHPYIRENQFPDIGMIIPCSVCLKIWARDVVSGSYSNICPC